ncbi:MAG: TonB-dependent receptor plug domain-containing protein [Ferruginibacter sp.]|nr:TonB-dependent receptor plug domain-containing protein [Ferruginibacter sp.]
MVYAQDNIKRIYVINNSSKIPVEDAFVQSEDLNFSVNADENGFVNLTTLPTMVKRILISRIGYESKTVELSSLNFANNTENIYLETKLSSLTEVTVKASANSGIFKTISDLDIHLRPINNSQEVLRMVPGLFIGQHAGGGKSEQIFLRGFDIDHGTDINITVDGMPVNMVSHAHGQGYADLHFVIPELIEKVNFNKGPYFADKGNFTTAGFVDFKTKNYLDNSFVKVEGGQFNTFRGLTALNLLKPQHDRRSQSLYFAGEASFTKGFFESPQNFNRFNGMLKYHGSISRKSTLTAMLTGFTSKWNASGQIPDRAVADGMIGFYGAIDDTEGGKTSRYNANIALATNLKNGAVLRNQMYYTHYEFKLFSNFTFFKEDPVNGDQIRQAEKRNLLGYHGSYQQEFSLGKVKTETKAGIQLRYDIIDDIELTRTKNRNIVTNEIMSGDVNELNAGAYWAQKFMFSKNLDITGGLRADYFTNRYNDKLLSQRLSSNSIIISPKLNFNYRVNDGVQLYFYNGRGFHSNDTRVAVQQNGKKVVPGAWGSDIGGIFKIGNKLVLQSALWYLWLDQEFIYVGDEGVVEPGGQTKRTGIDVSARYEVLKYFFADLDISIANPKATGVPKSENYLPLAPRFTSIGGITYRKEYGFNGSLRYRYMADRPANENNSTIARGYFIADAAVNYSKPKWEAGLAIQNLLNTKWKETQFDTESRLQNETGPVSEIHFTPGTPFFARLSFTVFF